MTNLTRLDVSRTATTDRGLLALAPLAQLETLNLYDTRVTDAGLAPLAALPRLRRVYLWQTDVTPAGVERLRASRPKLDIVLGDDEAAGQDASAGSGKATSRGREGGGRRRRRAERGYLKRVRTTSTSRCLADALAHCTRIGLW